jgi:TRAP-type C4-dicarboxylate transport system permease small subunit
VCAIFALLAVVCAGRSLYYTHLRMTVDCQSYKAYSVIWSLSTFFCCLACYLSMQACAKNYNDATTAFFDPNEQYTNLSVSTAPGISGIMSIVGFTVFAYVFILNLHMPAATIDDDFTEPLCSSADK